MLKKILEVPATERSSESDPVDKAKVKRKPRKSIWVFYKSEHGIDSERDQTIREFLGEDRWFGAGLDLCDGERDHSFYWSPEVEAKAEHLKNTGMISRIQIFESQSATA